jgi:hypothetical protein
MFLMKLNFFLIVALRLNKSPTFQACLILKVESKIISISMVFAQLIF